jgi:MFS family permease
LSALYSASRRRHFFLSFFLFLTLGFHVGVWAVQLGSLSAALRLDPSELGTALSGAAAGGIVTLFLGGRIADRSGRRAVLLLGFGVTGLAFAGLAAARSFPEVLVAVVTYGLAISFVDLGANAVGSDFESAYDTRALTGLQAGFSLGAVLGALFCALVLAAGVDYRLVYLALGTLFAFTAVVCSQASLPRRRPTTASDEALLPTSGVRKPPGVLFAAALLLICFFGDGALEGFLAVFLRQALDSGVLLSGLGIAAFHLASFLGRTISSRTQARLSPSGTIITAGVLAAIGMTGALLSPSTWGSVAGMLVVGFAISPVVPTALSLAGRSAPDHAGQAVAFTTAVGYTSFLVSPIVVGTIAASFGLRAGLAVVVATALTIAVLGSRWPSTDRSVKSRAASAE